MSGCKGKVRKLGRWISIESSLGVRARVRVRVSHQFFQNCYSYDDPHERQSPAPWNRVRVRVRGRVKVRVGGRVRFSSAP